MATNGVKLAAMIFGGFLLIEIGVTGKLGSILGSFIDPSNMQEAPASAGASGAGGDFGSAPQGLGQYQTQAWNDALAAGINPNLFVKQIQQESGFNPYAISPAGAVGIAQFMPSTAAQLGVNPSNPSQSLQGAANLMASYVQQYSGDYAKALAAYNAGSGAVNSAVSRCGSNWQSCIPAETQRYIKTIMG